MYFIYILQCDNDAYYTGITTDIFKRVKEHYYKTKNCAKYTRSRNVKSLAALWSTDTKTAALKLEAHIKRLKHSQKAALVSNPEEPALFLSALEEYHFTCIKDIDLEICLSEKTTGKNHIPC